MDGIIGNYVALLRHGEADRHAGAPLAGSLTAQGVEQARAAARYLSSLTIDHVVSSDTRRARETARLLDGPSTTIDPDLNGLRLAGDDDRPLTGLPHFVAVFSEPRRRPPGGESLEDLVLRGDAAVRRAAATASRVTVIAHRIFNSVVLGDRLGVSLGASVGLQQDPGAINIIERRPSGEHVICLNVRPDDPLRLSAEGRLLPDTDVPIERRLYLVRHAEASNIGDEGMESGGSQPLTPRGRHQAEALRDHFVGLKQAVFVASDLLRAEETARVLAEGRHVELRAGLRELSLGRLDGRPFHEIFEACPRFMVDPEARLRGGESPAECAARAVAEVHEVLARSKNRDVVAVTHGAVQRMITSRLLGVPDAVGVGLRTDWAGVTILDWAAGRWWVRVLNWTPDGVAELAHTAPVEGLTDEQSRILGR